MAAINRLFAKIFGAKPSPGSPYDGIIHPVKGPNGHALAFAERAAVARALNNIGYRNNDPNALRQAVDEYTELSRRFIKHYPEHQLAKHYTEKASQLNAPDVHSTEAGFHTVPTTGPAGEELGIAATPLIRFLNRLRHQASGEPLLNVERVPIEHPSTRTVEAPTPPVRPLDSRVKQPIEPGQDVPKLTPPIVTSATHKPIPLVGEPAAKDRKSVV